MAKALSLKLQDDIFAETESIVKQLKMPRNAYINQALRLFNKAQRRKAVGKLLQRESRLTASASLAVLEEFERCDKVPG